MINLERVKKTDEDIINTLTEDTKKSKLHWYTDDITIYTKILKIHGGDKIFVIFKLSDQLMEDEDDERFGFEFQYMTSGIITLDIYIKKNDKKEVYCKRISSHQLKLEKLMTLIYPNLLKKPIKK